MMAGFPIIGEDHPVTLVIKSGSLVTLKSMLRAGQVRPNSRQINSSTLLHVRVFRFHWPYLSRLRHVTTPMYGVAYHGVMIRWLVRVNALDPLASGRSNCPANRKFTLVQTKKIC